MDCRQSHHPADALVACMRQLTSEGLTSGTSGNCSVRVGDGMLITPTGMPPAQMTPESVVQLDLEGRSPSGSFAPSSEWPMHTSIYRARPDVAAVVHCHSRYATALACAGREIPAFHYLVAVAGGDSIRCAPYAMFGSAALGRLVTEALAGRRACLMSNHGQITVGPDLDSALDLARKVEELAGQYQACLAAGGPRLLGRSEMNEVLERIAEYGRPKPRP